MNSTFQQQPDFLLNPNPFHFQTQEQQQQKNTSTTAEQAVDQTSAASTQAVQLEASSTDEQQDPSLAQQSLNLTSSYHVNAFGVIDNPSSPTTFTRLGISNRIPGGGDCQKLCPRHQRMANQGTNRALQEEIEKLPQSDQEAINTAWSIFSASNVHRRRLILTGLLTICCPSQLTFLSDSLKSACRTDPFIRLPKETSLKILSYLDAFSLGRAAQVSKLWKKLADDDLLWHQMCQQHIEKTCQKCGWGLPSMKNRKRSPSVSNSIQSLKIPKKCITSSQLEIQSNDHHPSSSHPSIPISSSSSSTLSTQALTPSNSQSISPAPPTSPTSIQDSRKPWKSVYTERLALERNWRKGEYMEKILRGHSDSITTLQIDEQNLKFPILMTGSWDRKIKIWNLDTFECIQTLEGHSRGVKCLQFDHNKLISGGMDHVLKLWNWRTSECIRTIHGHSGGVTCLNFDDELLASGSADSTIRIWNFSTGAGYVLRGHQEWVNTVKLDTKTHQGTGRKIKLLYSGSDDGQIRIWNLSNRQTIKILNGHVAQVQSICLLTSDHLHLQLDSLISGSLDNCLKVWNLNINFDLKNIQNLNLNQDLNFTVDAACERTMFGHIQGVWSVDADKLRIASASHDRSLKIWDRVTGKCMHTFVGHRGAVSIVKLTDDKIISGGDDGEIRIWSFGGRNS